MKPKHRQHEETVQGGREKTDAAAVNTPVDSDAALHQGKPPEPDDMRPVREECSLASIRERGKSADSTLTVRSISYGSEAYAKSLQLRNKVLRRPLGRDIAHDDLSGDVQSRHIGAFLDTRLVGILLLRPIHRQVLQMKQVAVEESMRGLHIGRQMVEYAEKLAAGEGCQEIRLHARKVAIPFYEKLGYVHEGEPFEEIGIPHSLMKKRLM